ncbi:hypothetical protein HKX48_005461 [Thoreauomyces humboldtii]|nr:hypothetical protein HKX48_005461 [Thoreauomyces humboldtii]
MSHKHTGSATPSATQSSNHELLGRDKGKGPRSNVSQRTPDVASLAYSTTGALQSLLPNKGQGSSSNAAGPGAASSSIGVDTALFSSAQPYTASPALFRHSHDLRTGETLDEQDLFAALKPEWPAHQRQRPDLHFSQPFPLNDQYPAWERAEEPDGSAVLAFLATPNYTAEVHGDEPQRPIAHPTVHESVWQPPLTIRTTVEDGYEAIAYLRQTRYAQDMWTDAVDEFQAAVSLLQTTEADGQTDGLDSTISEEETQARVRSAVERLQMLRRHFQAK